MIEIQNINKIKEAIQYMEPFFDVVRLVDTRETKVMSFRAKTKSIEKTHQCYKMWNKKARCENCTSMNALLTGSPKEKYEFRDDEVYHVVSRPVKVVDETGKVHELILEIVNGVADHSLFEKFGMSAEGDKTIIELITDTYRKIYEDALTSVYNRRYLEEFRFLYHNNNEVSKQVAFIMVDLKAFKKINDTMGHETGDHVLIEVASLFKKNIRSQDSVIRLGGDEFVIVLVNYPKDQIVSKMKLLQNEIRKIPLESKEQSHVDIDWGYTYTENFKISKKYLDTILKQADDAMYIMKKDQL
ncbi:GGDEF domain-containing protein [Niameybacter massiliensis]|uniref:GGDEF domain-containing protein n=1 Tax=Niameybacter massiliensis TaxID=1658108 RepID=UPI0006B4072D|nr:GGDEF domain-containing protein [Niameybacter massiliensis]